MSLHYAWCNRHIWDEDTDYCDQADVTVGEAKVCITAGGDNFVPAIDAQGSDSLTADEARRFAKALMAVADALEASPLPDQRRADV